MILHQHPTGLSQTLGIRRGVRMDTSASREPVMSVAQAIHVIAAFRWAQQTADAQSPEFLWFQSRRLHQRHRHLRHTTMVNHLVAATNSMPWFAMGQYARPRARQMRIVPLMCHQGIPANQSVLSMRRFSTKQNHYVFCCVTAILDTLAQREALACS